MVNRRTDKALINIVRQKRLKYWQFTFLESALVSQREAARFLTNSDYFTAYLYLFIAFNNAYSLLNNFAQGGQKESIRATISQLADDQIEAFYDKQYLEAILFLNESPPLQVL